MASKALLLTLAMLKFCAAYNWTRGDEDLVCGLASEKLSFCSVKGAADQGCQTVATKVSGLEPSCYEENVCSFTKDGAPAYVSADSVKPGYEITRNCVNNIGIANGSKDLNRAQDVASYSIPAV